MRACEAVLSAILTGWAVWYAYRFGRYHERYYGRESTWGIMSEEGDQWS